MVCIRSCVIAALAGTVGLSTGIAQAEEITPSIKLMSRVITPGTAADTSSQDVAQAMKALAARRILLQFHQLPDDSDRQKLAAAGIHLLDYVPDKAWFARIDRDADLTKAPLQLIRWAGAVHADDRISPALRTSGVGKWALGSDGSVTLRVAFFQDVPWEEITALFHRQDAEYLTGDDNANYVLRFRDASAIKRLASEDIVQWIDNGPAPRRPRDVSNTKGLGEYLLKNDGARDITRVNALQTAVPGANGAGTILAVFDGGVDPAHPDFADRLTVDPQHSQPAESHGTHVAGTMAGSGANSEAHAGSANQHRGIATAATVLSLDNNTNRANADYFASHQGAIQTANADLSQNSWGGNFTSQVCNTHNVYSVDSQNMDRIVSGQAYGRGIVVSVAASNFRAGTSDNQAEQSPICNFAGGPDFINYTSLSDLGSAKNILSVGATQKVATNRMADFSSWGPTRDGRLKPDIVAPGEDIRSSIPGGGYGIQSGTSMATPHISGIAALLIQRYRQVFANASPRPATTRAILVHSARDLQADHVYYTPGPDFASGYGIADAEAAYAAIVGNRIAQAQIANGATDSRTVVVAAAQAELKVTLTWDDPAATLGTMTQLVNNLDLELVAPDGTTLHLPWVLDPANPAAAATRGVDNLNNTEQVQVANPAAGTWTVRVKGTAIPTSPQPYSLVSSLALQTGAADPDRIFRDGFEQP